MLYVVETGGKQYVVKEGDTILVEKIEAADGSSVKLPVKAMFENGSVTTTDSAKAPVINAVVVKQQKGPKIHIFKYKRRKAFDKKTGHRQKYTLLQIAQEAKKE